MLAYHARRSFEAVFGPSPGETWLHQIYDIAHNMAKIETHRIEGQDQTVCVHRKGATRALNDCHRGFADQSEPHKI